VPLGLHLLHAASKPAGITQFWPPTTNAVSFRVGA